MNIFKSSFLIIGEGITFEHCSNFFKDNDILYYSTTTDDIIDINNSEIICKKKKIDLDKVDYVVVSPGIPPTNLYIRKKVNSFFLNFSVRLENFDENFFSIKSLKK